VELVAATLATLARPYLSDVVQMLADVLLNKYDLPAGTESPTASPSARVSTGIRFDGNDVVPAFYVDQAGGEAHHAANDIVNSLNGRVDVVVRGQAHSAWPSARADVPTDSLKIGDSISHQDGFAGTLGCFVTAKGSPGRPCFIGAAHVLSRMNSGRAGDAVLRPGPPDGPRSKRSQVGTLRDFSFLTRHDADLTDALTPNLVDAALVGIGDGIAHDSSNLVPHPKGGRRRRIKSCVPDDELSDYRSGRVFKFGRTTKLTKGTFLGIDGGPIDVRLPDGRLYRFLDLIIIEKLGPTFSADGDSGSLVVTDDIRALGLIVAGTNKHSYAVPIERCLKELDAELV
jgi:hypothetical protein